MAAQIRMQAEGSRTARIPILISMDSIFLPRYSGVRPTINPIMNTVSNTKTSIPYRPQPTPPKTTSPSLIWSMVMKPDRGVRLSCIAFTAPLATAVVAVAKRAESAMPKRTSLPSMAVGLLTWRALISGFPAASL
jgi:hypothetical protein